MTGQAQFATRAGVLRCLQACGDVGGVVYGRRVVVRRKPVMCAAMSCLATNPVGQLEFLTAQARRHVVSVAVETNPG